MVQTLGYVRAIPDIFRIVGEPVAEWVALQDQFSQLPSFQLVQLLHSTDLILAEVERGDVGGSADYVLHRRQRQHAVVAQVQGHQLFRQTKPNDTSCIHVKKL